MKKFNMIVRQCHQCRHIASSNSNVNIHKETVHEEVLHDCKHCDQCRHISSSNTNVYVHKQTMHEGVLS